MYIGNSTGGCVVRGDLNEEVTFQQILEGEGVSQAVAGAMESQLALQLMLTL